jgi:hypothetical protein
VGVLFDYFAAPDDAAAGAVVERGPTAVFDTVATKVDCVVALAFVEELLGGRSVDEQLDDPRAGRLVEQRGDGYPLVLSISDHMKTALANAPDAELERTAREWSLLPEFGGVADPADLESVLRDLCALARTATDATHGLYCWACV